MILAEATLFCLAYTHLHRSESIFILLTSLTKCKVYSGTSSHGPPRSGQH